MCYSVSIVPMKKMCYLILHLVEYRIVIYIQYLIEKWYQQFLERTYEMATVPVSCLSTTIIFVPQHRERFEIIWFQYLQNGKLCWPMNLSQEKKHHISEPGMNYG